MNDLIRQTKGRIHSIESFGAVDGPGVRFVVFFQGCPLRCRYCHNPDSWNFAEGTEKTAGEMIDQIADYRNFIRKGGVTLSGGDPLAQPDFCAALLRLCREQGFHTAVDTSGFIPLSKCRHAVDEADMLLLDIKDIDADDCKELTGQGNENAFALLDYCEQQKKTVWIRHVCVPGYTLKEDKLNRLAKRLSGYSCIEKIELIPFHQLGSYKWDYVDKEYLLGEVEPPSQSDMEQARELVRKYGFEVQ